MNDATGALLQDVWLVPMDGPDAAPLGDVRRGDLRVRDGRIVALGALVPEPGERVIAGRGRHALPGFVQGHVHATQTLFRGLADDLPLLDWLRTRIWPLEHAHDAASTRVSAELTFAELLAGGTTTAQTMESVRHAEVVAEEAQRSGMTVITGNCLMDEADPHLPPGMATSAAEALAITDELRRAFHGHGRISIAVSPRFVLSVSEGLARDAAAFAQQHDLRVHTHAAEHPAELAAVRARFHRDYVQVLHGQGLLGARTALAHCVHTSEAERDLLAATRSSVLHCPSTNLKLGSGIAPLADYRRRGIAVGIGADGAPCNNRLSMLTELRQAALLQALDAGPGQWPAAAALAAATRGGAAALGLTDVGQLAPGKRADVVLFDLQDPRLGVIDAQRPASALVYAASERHVDAVMLGGEFVVEGGRVLGSDWHELRRAAAAALPGVLRRAGLAR
ncbi:MAG: amidohydrolase family protein [Planctomycetes bacterium]|nr:amidohydrolase family protein [Planctomycetota bacterium]